MVHAKDELEQALYTLPRDVPEADILRRMIHEAIELRQRRYDRGDGSCQHESC
jgi:hypothetical protein